MTVIFPRIGLRVFQLNIDRTAHAKISFLYMQNLAFRLPYSGDPGEKNKKKRWKNPSDFGRYRTFPDVWTRYVSGNFWSVLIWNSTYRSNETFCCSDASDLSVRLFISDSYAGKVVNCSQNECDNYSRREFECLIVSLTASALGGGRGTALDSPVLRVVLELLMLMMLSAELFVVGVVYLGRYGRLQRVQTWCCYLFISFLF